jgi:hypothetical protein
MAEPEEALIELGSTQEALEKGPNELSALAAHVWIGEQQLQMSHEIADVLILESLVEPLEIDHFRARALHKDVARPEITMTSHQQGSVRLEASDESRKVITTSGRFGNG